MFRPCEEALLPGVAVSGSSDTDRRVLAMKAQESNVALVATIGPDEQEGIEKMFEETSTSRAPYESALAPRALAHAFRKQELHESIGPRSYLTTRPGGPQ